MFIFNTEMLKESEIKTKAVIVIKIQNARTWVS